MIKRALISVYDKTGILEVAKNLIKKDVEIISSGGTYKYLKENGIKVIEVNEVTMSDEMLDGRVKTLHPNIHGGILAIRDNKNHMETLNSRNIKTIDLVIVNLYPFFEKVKENLTFEEKIEFIDIGGPTMLRSAAKNFKDV
ncbi:MAG: bifunctional phosphoribosylaminoimidazolecarboxamide formyltransferase/IMP cyclohydrolase, partial [Sarcina sp.]